MKQAVGRVDGNFKNHPQQNWTVSKVKRILDNEMYLGNMVQSKLKSAGVGSKRQVRVPEKEWSILTREDLNTSAIPGIMGAGMWLGKKLV